MIITKWLHRNAGAYWRKANQNIFVQKTPLKILVKLTPGGLDVSIEYGDLKDGYLKFKISKTGS